MRISAMIAALIFCGLMSEQTQAIEFPEDVRAWINSPPISVESMRGKSIVLYFYEEGCPRCRENWTKVVEAANESTGKPVMLIAVNSGNSAMAVAQYVTANRLTFPVIVDTDRSLEVAAGIGEVSLKNIWQAIEIDPQGTVTRVSATDLSQSMASAASKASWNVDPQGMPAAILPLWKQIEFGHFQGTAKLVERSLKDRNADVKAAAESLSAYAAKQIEELATQAESAAASGDQWQTWKLYDRMMREFAGYTISESATNAFAALSKSDEIQRQKDAMKQWVLVQKTMTGSNPSRGRIEAMLGKLIEKYPDTEAAALAQAAKTQFGSVPR